MGEPGALNEANSDFLGKLVSNDGWAMGKGVFIHPTAGNDAIRDLANPARLHSVVSLANGQTATRPYPVAITQEVRPFQGCDESNDDCNVHYNSTIPSHAMYLMAQVVGKDVAGKIQYAVLTHAMGPNTGFRQYGAAVRQVCTQLYDARTCQAVAQAYASVGL
jgi:Zn-dependent metalloprotease